MRDAYKRPVINDRIGKCSIQVDAIIDRGETKDSAPVTKFDTEDRKPHLGPGCWSIVHLVEGQSISFVLRDVPQSEDEDKETPLNHTLLDQLQKDTSTYWYNWINQSKYKGRNREIVSRSLMILKMLTYEPTGAIVAAPTFALPEDIGGTRNWVYIFLKEQNNLNFCNKLTVVHRIIGIPGCEIHVSIYLNSFRLTIMLKSLDSIYNLHPSTNGLYYRG